MDWWRRRAQAVGEGEEGRPEDVVSEREPGFRRGEFRSCAA